MGRKLIPNHEHGPEARFPPAASTSGTLSSLSPPFGGLSQGSGQITYVLRTRAPLYSETEVPFLVRLACVKYAASVRSEPGSNSPYKSSATSRLCMHNLALHPRALTSQVRISITIVKELVMKVKDSVANLFFTVNGAGRKN
jgi:hypothetical protein